MTEPFDSIEATSAYLRSASASVEEARLSTIEMRDAGAAALASAQARYDELKAKYDALVNPPPPPPVNPSGQRMPTEDLPGYRLSWSEDFNTPAEPGQIRDVYGNKMKFYPPKPTTAFYSDTSGRGHYETDNLSAANGKLRYHVHTTANGIHHVGAVLPTLSDLGGYGAVDAGRFSVRWRSDLLPTYKVAWLLWPIADPVDGKVHWPRDGEIDFPERPLSGPTVQGFVHLQDATVGSDQASVKVPCDLDWHTCVTEWKAGAFCRFYLDGALIKNVTSRVPKRPMRWTLQTETTLDKSVAINNLADGHVEIDWLAYWAPA